MITINGDKHFVIRGVHKYHRSFSYMQVTTSEGYRHLIISICVVPVLNMVIINETIGRVFTFEINEN